MEIVNTLLSNAPEDLQTYEHVRACVYFFIYIAMKDDETKKDINIRERG